MKKRKEKILIKSLNETAKGMLIGLYSGIGVYIYFSKPYFIYGFYLPKVILLLIPPIICFVAILGINLTIQKQLK